MAEIHAHEVLHMMEGNSYTKETLIEEIVKRFGADAMFGTCSAKGLKIEALVDFLEAKGKFKPMGEGFTMDITKVCENY